VSVRLSVTIPFYVETAKHILKNHRETSLQVGRVSSAGSETRISFTVEHVNYRETKTEKVQFSAGDVTSSANS